MQEGTQGIVSMVEAQVERVFSPYALARFTQILEGAHHLRLVCHARPDGDAVGSMLGLGLVLQSLGYDVRCTAPNGIPKAFAWLEGGTLVDVFEEDAEAVNASSAACDALICLDFNDIRRVDPPLAELLADFPCPRIMLDHHVGPSDDFDLYFSYPFASSASEVVYELVMRLWGQEAITPAVAQALYMGIMTDTGSFSYACHSRRPYTAAGHLLERGADVAAIRSHVYGSYSEGRMRLYGCALHERMVLVAGGQAAMIDLPRKLLQHFDFQPGDTEGLVNEPLCIDGLNVSVLLTERNAKSVRVSLRSRNGIVVNGLAQRYFNGGGHPQAAGGLLHMPLGEAIVHTRRILSAFVAGKLNV